MFLPRLGASSLTPSLANSLTPLPQRSSTSDLPTPQLGESNLPARPLKRWLANTGSATACGTEVSNFSQRIKRNSGGLW